MPDRIQKRELCETHTNGEGSISYPIDWFEYLQAADTGQRVCGT